MTGSIDWAFHVRLCCRRCVSFWPAARTAPYTSHRAAPHRRTALHRIVEWEGVDGVRASPSLGRRWLMQMGAGAAKRNVTIQYCMALMRMVLQSVEIPQVLAYK